MNNNHPLLKYEAIIMKVLEGKINYTELKRHEFQFTSYGELGQVVFEDLEEAVEHTPGYFFKRGIDLNKWLTQYEYWSVNIDYILLKKTIDDPLILNFRTILLKKYKILNINEIENIVDKMFENYSK